MHAVTFQAPGEVRASVQRRPPADVPEPGAQNL